MSEIQSFLINLKTQLTQSIDPIHKQNYSRRFKEDIKVYGIKSPTLKIIIKENRKLIKDLPKGQILEVCEELHKSDFCEESFIASAFSHKLNKQYEKEDFQIFQKWIEEYINNRAKCDTFCNHTMWDFIQMYSEFLSNLKLRTQSENRRVKRATAVSLIVPAKKWLFLSDVFEIADALLLDQDDMVQKWYGWLLKVASHTHEKEVFEYVMKHKAVMPRTALRYAIEKMSKELKIQAMKK